MGKTNYGCEANYAACLITELTPNSQSSLVDETCISQQDFNEDVYGQLGAIHTQSDLSALGNECMTYVQVGGKTFVKNVLLKMEEKICELLEEVATLKTVAVCNLDITSCNFNYGGLTLPCGETPQTLAEVIQLILTEKQNIP